MNLDIIKTLPPQAHDGEYVAIDSEIFGIPKGQLHRPVGTFGCLSVCLERDWKEYQITRQLTPDAAVRVYQFYDPADVQACVERLAAGKWIFQNAKFDLRQMRRWSVVEPRRVWDTMMVDQGLFGGYYNTFDLGSLSLRWLKEYLPKEVREEFATATEMTPDMMKYAALDPVVTLRVALAQMEYIETTGEPMDHYWKADHPALWAVLDMPPVHIDTEAWHNLAVDFTAKADAIRSQYSINIASTQQVGKQLADLMNYKGTYKSTDEDHLLEVRDRAAGQGRGKATQFIDDVLNFRGYAKMAGTYGDNWITKYIEDGCYIYPDWKVTGALTGRMSCSEPAMQTIPAREYPIFRTFFTASPGRVIMGADVAQQEPRILAVLSKDKFLTRTLIEGRSPHVAVGADIYKDPNFSKKDERYKIAKAANLGTSYVLSARGLAGRTGLSLDEAENFLANYFKVMPGVKAYINHYRQLAARQGYVRTLTGRRAWINPYGRTWQNNAINSPIQGTAADQTKMAVGFMHQMARERGLPFCVNLIVHDETAADVPVEIRSEYQTIIHEAWQEAGRVTMGDTIPMVIEPFEGVNWGSKGD